MLADLCENSHKTNEKLNGRECNPHMVEYGPNTIKFDDVVDILTYNLPGLIYLVCLRN